MSATWDWSSLSWLGVSWMEMVGAEVVMMLAPADVNATGNEVACCPVREAEEAFGNGDVPNALDCSGFLLIGMPQFGYRNNNPRQQ